MATFLNFDFFSIFDLPRAILKCCRVNAADYSNVSACRHTHLSSIPLIPNKSLRGGSRIGKTARQRLTPVPKPVPKPGEHKATRGRDITRQRLRRVRRLNPPALPCGGIAPMPRRAAGAQTSSFPRRIWVVWQIHRGAAVLCPQHSPSPPNRCRQSKGWYCNQSGVNVHMLKGFRLTPTVPSPQPQEKRPKAPASALSTHISSAEQLDTSTDRE